MDFVDNGLHLGISHASATSALGLHRQHIRPLLTKKPSSIPRGTFFNRYSYKVS